jgi:hypothetical protein
MGAFSYDRFPAPLQANAGSAGLRRIDSRECVVFATRRPDHLKSIRAYAVHDFDIASSGRDVGPTTCAFRLLSQSDPAIALINDMGAATDPSTLGQARTKH